MVLIEWTDEWSVNVPVLDEDHRALFKAVNAFYDAAIAGTAVDELRVRFEELVVHARAHFAREEEIMARADFNRLAWHKEEHEKILVRLIDFCREHMLAGDGRAVPDEAGDFLRRWVLEHIEEEDFCFKRFLERQELA